jgi:hypothetical protein
MNPQLPPPVLATIRVRRCPMRGLELVLTSPSGRPPFYIEDGDGISLADANGNPTGLINIQVDLTEQERDLLRR